jgi:formate hydrogenlyase subunit 3/multisubunit Na+/H+ antiporter MnhD subunit
VTVVAIGAVVTFAVLAAMVPAVLRGEVPTSTLLEVMPGLELSLRADAMGMVFALLAGFLWVLAAPYAIGYIRATTRATGPGSSPSTPCACRRRSGWPSPATC